MKIEAAVWKDFREENKLTQLEFAELCGLGVDIIQRAESEGLLPDECRLGFTAGVGKVCDARAAARERLVADVPKRLYDPEYQSRLLQGLGFEGALSCTGDDGNPLLAVSEVWRAAKSVGFTSFQQFFAVDPGLLFAIFEAKVRALEQVSHDGECPAEDDIFLDFKHLARTAGGRPTGMKIDGEAIKGLRQSKRLTQFEFAELCGVSVDTVQRAESGTSISDACVSALAEGLSKVTGRRFSSQHLQ